MSASAQPSWKPPGADRQPSGWSPPDSDRAQPAQPGVLESALSTAGGIVKGTATLGWHTLQSLLGDDEPLRKDAEEAVKSQADQWAKAKEALNRGDRVEAVGHGMAALLPFVGPGAAHVGETAGGELRYDAQGHPIGVIRDPNVRGAIGEGAVLVGSTLAPEVIRKTAASPTVGRVVEATGAGVRAAAPDVATGTAKVGVGVGAHYLPIPAEVKYGVGIPTVGAGARQIGRGLKTGVEAARASFAETAPQQAAAATPVVAPPLQLGPGPTITPAPADTSFVRSVPGMYPTGPNPLRALPPAPARVLEMPPPGAAPSGIEVTPELLDDVARGQIGKPFRKLNAQDQAAVVELARRIKESETPRPAAAAPTDTSSVRAIPAQYPDIVPPHLRANAPAETAAVSLRDLMRESGTLPPETPAAAPEAPAGEAGNPFEAYARIAKAQRLAKAANESGLTAQDAHDMITDDANRNAFAQAMHEDSVSPQTMALIEGELRKLQPAKRRTGR
jgi:hypothetical protein